jgi:glucose-6-phosphate isomerase
MTIKIDTKNSLVDNFNSLIDKINSVKNLNKPSFSEYNIDINKIKEDSKPLEKYENIIIIGNGGSVNSSRAFYNAIDSKRNFCFVMTMEPDFLNEVLTKYPKENSIVVAISKSGSTIGVLESLMFFINNKYDISIITSFSGPLYEIAKKNNYHLIKHPNIGGRYSARTSSTLIPAYLMGYDLDELNKGFEIGYENYSFDKNFNDNDAFKLACVLYNLELNGKTDVFMPIYSSKLSGFLVIIVQLMHESFGKEKKGMSFFGDLAPESQHHTNQRFFGGKDNICGVFVNVLNQDDKELKVIVPKELENIKLGNNTLSSLSNIPYHKSLQFEFLGTYNDAINQKIPISCVSVDKIDFKTIGEFMAFWQYFAVYSSILREVNPYDQPQVETSKVISIKMRENFLKTKNI